MTQERRRHPLPGDTRPETEVARMIRVDHAGEYGAARIYEGQLAVLGRSRAAAPIRAMAEQEKRHLAAFEKLVVSRRVRPTLLSPLWDVAGFALGAASALMGERAAMACTVAVEEVIDEHYRRQSEALAPTAEAGGSPNEPPEDSEAELRRTIDEFRADELHHRDVALAHGAQEMLGYTLFTAAVKTGSRLAIWLSTRI